jgi:hypothetical protein
MILQQFIVCSAILTFFHYIVCSTKFKYFKMGISKINERFIYTFDFADYVLTFAAEKTDCHCVFKSYKEPTDILIP